MPSHPLSGYKSDSFEKNCIRLDENVALQIFQFPGHRERSLINKCWNNTEFGNSIS